MTITCKAIKNGICISGQGDYRPCYLHDFNPDHTVEKMSIEEYRQTVLFPMYDKMKAGEFPEGCWKCKATPHYTFFNEEVADYTNNTLTDDLLILDISFSNLCNNGCIMCNSRNSSYYKKIEDKNMFVWGGQKNAITTNINHTDKIYKNILENSTNIKELYLKGGEPTVDEKALEILDYLIENKRLDVTIRLNTNLTNTNKKFLDRVEKFYRKRIAFSIDAYGELNNILRHPSNYEAVIKNLQLWKDIQHDYDSYDVTSVISLYNFYNFPKLYNHIKQLWPDLHHSINILQTPLYMDIAHMDEKTFVRGLHGYPAHLKDKLKSYYYNKIKNIKSIEETQQDFFKRSRQWFETRNANISITENPFFNRKGK